MAETYVVKQGDCLSTIARRFGLVWQEIWNAPENADFKKRRKNPDILFPGDVLAIPTAKPITLTLPTGKRHEIKIKATKVRLCLNVQVNGEPLGGKKFRLDVEGDVQEGTTGGDGSIDVPVPIHAATATLELPEVPFRRALQLGALDPVDTVTGAQARLQNLGALPLAVTGELDDPTRQALCAFQAGCALDATGELDDATIAALEDEYGC